MKLIKLQGELGTVNTYVLTLETIWPLIARMKKKHDSKKL